LFAAAYAVPPVMFARGAVGAAGLLPWVTVPFAVVLVRELAREEGKALNRTLAKTSMLLLAFGVLFALGIAVS
jgi:1,4-dihydroxy-2-naphthoate octaprenyltransferase